MSNLLIKETALGVEKIFPKNYILNLVDKESGKTLLLILNSFNMLFLNYIGNKADTRKQVPTMLRKLGLWITYVVGKTTVTEWYNSQAIDDTTWGASTYWVQGSNMLVGDVAISANGTWVINGLDTGISPKGDKGETPLIRVKDNLLLVSYDNGTTYNNLTNTPIYTKFRFNSLTNTYLVSYDLGGTWQDISDEKVYHKFRYNNTTNTYLESIDFGKTWSNISAEKVYYLFRYNAETNTHLVSTDLGLNWTDVSSNKVYYLFRTGDNRLLVSTDLGTTWENCSEPIAAWFRWADTSGTGNVGKVLISRDNKTWSDLSPTITNNLYIKGYVSTVGDLPTSSAAIGDIYMVGPTYDESDTTHDYPHYRMWVKLSSGWVDNGEFTNAGPVGTNNIIDKAVTLNKLSIDTQAGIIYDVSAHNNGAVFESLQALLSSSNLSTLIPTSVRHGGMTIRFIQGSEQSSDNKYVQARCMAQDFTTDVTQWQGVDDEPTVGSNNLVKSGGIYNSINVSRYFVNPSSPILSKIVKELYINSDVDLSNVDSVIIYKANPRSGGYYRVGITFENNGSTVVSGYTDYSTLEEANASMTGAIEKRGNISYIFDWGALNSNRLDSTIELTYNVKNLDTSPSIKTEFVENELNPSFKYFTNSGISQFISECYLDNIANISQINKVIIYNCEYRGGTGKYRVGVLFEGTNIAVYNYSDKDTQEEAQVITQNNLFVFGNNKYIINWNNIPSGGRIEKTTNVKDTATKIYESEQIVYIEQQQYNSKIKSSVFNVFFSDDFLSSVIKECYVNISAENIALIDTVILYNCEARSGGVYRVGIAFENSGSTVLICYKDYTTLEDAEAAKQTHIFAGIGYSFIIDWDSLTNTRYDISTDVYATINKIYESKQICYEKQQETNQMLSDRIDSISTSQNMLLRIGSFNIHFFYYGGTGTEKGYPSQMVDQKLPLWKELISKWLSSDFLILNEYFEYFDREHTINAYDTLLKQFYPYYSYDGKEWIFCKYPCQFEIVINGTALAAKTAINGKSVAVICWHDSNTIPVASRQYHYTAIINYLASFDVGIVAGDFNNDPGPEELVTFTDAGYTLGNSGYWGNLPTCNFGSESLNKAIDNIVVKGGILDLFEYTDNRIDSDHNPVRANIII